MSCPAGFEIGALNSCRIVCPTDYKYIQDSGVEKCVSSTDNRYFVKLQTIPQGASTTAFSDEQARFLTELIKVSKTVQADQAAAAKLRSVSDNDVEAHHEQIQSTHGVAATYAEAIAELKPLRPPTQPNTDIASMRLSIKDLAAIDIRTLQICLFFVVIALLEYFLLPTSIVHGAAFFTLCVGFSLAIYLSKR